jgi:hypothetical protein
VTQDNIETRQIYRSVYCNWPVSVIIAHLIALDIKVDKMHPDEMIAARKLMDDKISVWK